MRSNTGTVIGIILVATALNFAKASLAQTIEERRAAARQRAQEGLLYISNLLATAQAEAEAQRAALPPRPPVDPEAARAAAEKQRYAMKRQLAPWLFGDDGLPTADGATFFGNKAGQERALAASRLPRIRPRINPERLACPTAARRSQTTILTIPGVQTNAGADPLYLALEFAPLAWRCASMRSVLCLTSAFRY